MNYDKKYSEKVWQVAKDAIRRASQNKTIYYSEDTKDSPGAGDYADKDLTDDWYAALSEALITASLFHETANAKTFRERVRQNRYFLTFDNEGSQSWASAQGAASLSLWLHWDITGLNYLEKDILQQNILSLLVVYSQTSNKVVLIRFTKVPTPPLATPQTPTNRSCNGNGAPTR